jgi:catechol 2,3-dioxygenase-like lactoylglutathione lyase family enzyme
MKSPHSNFQPQWIGIDHVQLAMPRGAEDIARSFYVDVLGLVEQPKPDVMAARGGAWFEHGDVRIHLGVEDDFVAARKAHPAITMRGLREFIVTSGLDAMWNTEIDGVVRCHVADPFGNRIELIEAGNQ